MAMITREALQSVLEDLLLTFHSFSRLMKYRSQMTVSHLLLFGTRQMATVELVLLLATSVDLVHVLSECKHFKELYR